MPEPKVSLVFPCYHAGKHMPHVLDDLQAQTFTDFEVILVNDGDDSQLEAMETIAAMDSRIRIVSLPHNRGVAAARNAGTDAATTEWVTYPDPDDRLGPNYIKSLYEVSNGTDVDMVCGGYTKFIVEENKEEQHSIHIESNLRTMDIASAYELMLQPIAYPYAWNKLYSISLVRENMLHQDESIKTSQDYAFNMVYFMYVKKVGLTQNCDYTYYKYPDGSNSRRYHNRLMQLWITITDLRTQFHQHIGWTEQQVKQYKQKDLCMAALKLCKNIFAYDSSLTYRQKVKEIQTEIMDNQEVVNAVIQADFGNDHIWNLHQRLISSGNARLTAYTLGVLYSIKRRLPNTYLRFRPLFRSTNINNIS